MFQIVEREFQWTLSDLDYKYLKSWETSPNIIARLFAEGQQGSQVGPEILAAGNVKKSLSQALWQRWRKLNLQQYE